MLDSISPSLSLPRRGERDIIYQFCINPHHTALLLDLTIIEWGWGWYEELSSEFCRYQQKLKGEVDNNTELRVDNSS